MNVLICSPSDKSIESLERMLSEVGQAQVIGRAANTRETIDILTRQDVDLSIVEESCLDIGLAVRQQLSAERTSRTVWVAFLDRPAVPTVIKAAQYGYNDVIVAPGSSRELESELMEVVQLHRSVQTNPLLSSVDLVPGLYARRIRHSDSVDEDLVELLGLGLDDRDIGHALGLSIQEIRNRMSALLQINGLANRTQLATLHIRGQMATWLV